MFVRSWREPVQNQNIEFLQFLCAALAKLIQLQLNDALIVHECEQSLVSLIAVGATLTTRYDHENIASCYRSEQLLWEFARCVHHHNLVSLAANAGLAGSL